VSFFVILVPGTHRTENLLTYLLTYRIVIVEDEVCKHIRLMRMCVRCARAKGLYIVVVIVVAVIIIFIIIIRLLCVVGV